MSYGQQFDDYKPLKAKGSLPVDITQRTFLKVQSGYDKTIEEQDSKQTKKVKSKFILQSNYALDELLTSGIVLFGDTITNYINKIASKLLNNNQKLRDELRFYSIKTDVTNAFSTDQGMIFVTLGLISQLENEDQLAFVLAHEIVHYIKKHSITKAIISDEVFRGKNEYYKNNSTDNNIKILSTFSKQYELEADSLAINLIANSGYNLKKAKGIFTVLEYSYLPFEEESVNFSFLESDGFEIDKYYVLDSISPIIFKETKDDKYGSHPNIDRRREQFDRITSSLSVLEVKYNQKPFQYIKKISRFEIVRINLDEFDYSRALYNSHILLKNDPNSFYLRKSVAQALYGISKFNLIKKGRLLNRRSKEDSEGEISAMHYFIEKLDTKTSSSLFIRYTWELNTQHTDSILLRLLEDVILELKKDYHISFSNYLSKPVSIADSSVLRKSKTQKIKDAQQSGSDSSPNYRTFLIGVNERDELKKTFNKVKYYSKTEGIVVEEGLGKHEIAISEPIGSVLFVDPKYYFIDKRKGLKLINSEKKKYIFYKQIEDNSSRAELKTDILSFKEMTSGDVNSYNKLNDFNSWIKDNFICHSIKEKWKFITPRSNDVINELKEYNTNYLAYSGVFVYNENRPFFNEPLSFTILFPYTLPVGIAVALTPKHYTYYYTIIYNVTTGEIVLDKIYDVGIKANSATVNSFMYDLMKQIVKKK